MCFPADRLLQGYLPTLLQLYATDVFAFGTQQNGWLIFMYSMLRGVFLTFAFPKAISLGRAFTTARQARIRKRNALEQTESNSDTTERDPLLGRTSKKNNNATARQVDTNSDHDQDEHVKDDTAASKKQTTFTFDLTYTRGYVRYTVVLSFILFFTVTCNIPCLTFVWNNQLPHRRRSTHAPLLLCTAGMANVPRRRRPSVRSGYGVGVKRHDIADGRQRRQQF